MTPREIIAEALDNYLKPAGVTFPDGDFLAGLCVAALQAKAMLPKEDEVIVKREASEAMLSAGAQVVPMTGGMSQARLDASSVWTAMIQASEKEG